MAQASTWVAEAELTRAKLLWIPTLNMGFDYIRHDGGGPDFNKGIMTAPSVNFFYGGVGMWGTIPTTDAIFAATGRAAGPELRTLGHPDREEQRPARDRRRLLPACTSIAGCMPVASTPLSVGMSWSSGSRNLSRELVPKVEVDRARNLLAELEQQAV